MLQKVRKLAVTLTSASYVAMLVTTSACSSVAPTETVAARLPVEGASKVSDRELFRGILMGGGEVARAIPAIRDHYSLDNLVSDSSSRARAEVVQYRLIQRVDSIEPGATSRFAAAVRSRDAFQIRDAIESGAKVLSLAMREEAELKPIFDAGEDPVRVRAVLDSISTAGRTARVMNPASPEHSGSYDGRESAFPVAAVAVLAAVYLGVVVDVLLVYTAGVVYAVASWITVTVAEPTKAGPSLTTEMVVADIVKAIGA